MSVRQSVGPSVWGHQVEKWENERLDTFICGLRRLIEFCSHRVGREMEVLGSDAALVHGRRFGCCVEDTLSKFYRTLNSILRVDGKSNDIVMLRLIEAHCVSLLSYAVEVGHVADKKQSSNSIFRKLLGYSYRESVTALQNMLGRPAWEKLVTKRSNNFTKRFTNLPADSLVRIASS